MQITDATPTVVATVGGLTLSMPQPFAEGYQLTATEAAAFNQLLTENLRNNIAAKMKKASDAKTPWDEAKAQAELKEYSQNYQFGVRLGGTRSVDPVTRIVEEMAEAKIRAALKAKGIKMATVTKEAMENLIAQVIAKDTAAEGALRKEAERRVKSEAKFAVADLEGLV